MAQFAAQAYKNKQVSIWLQSKGQWVDGKVAEFSAAKMEHVVKFDDGNSLSLLLAAQRLRSVQPGLNA